MLPRLLREAEHPKSRSIRGIVALDIAIAPLIPAQCKGQGIKVGRIRPIQHSLQIAGSRKILLVDLRRERIEGFDNWNVGRFGNEKIAVDKAFSLVDIGSACCLNEDPSYLIVANLLGSGFFCAGPYLLAAKDP